MTETAHGEPSPVNTGIERVRVPTRLGEIPIGKRFRWPNAVSALCEKIDPDDPDPSTIASRDLPANVKTLEGRRKKLFHLDEEVIVFPID